MTEVFLGYVSHQAPARRRTALELRLLDGIERRRAGDLWRALEGMTGSPGIACSWDWTEAWLRHYGDLVSHRFAVAHRDGEPAGIALLCHGIGQRRGGLPVRTIHVGTAGEPPPASVYVEYNRLLVRDDDRAAFAAALLRCMRGMHRWDELRLDGFAPEDARAFAAAEPRLVQRFEPAPVRDLRPAREHGDAIATLGAGTRWRVRRSMRLLGPLRGEWASTPQQARDVLDELIALHQARWTASGLPGLFSAEHVTAFHRDLVPRLLARGRVMLYRVSGAAGTVGCLYGYVEQRRLLIYQSGFAAFPGDNRIKPGLVTHAMCMQAALEAGLDEYDLLAGDQRYKRELTATERQLVWARVVRRRPRPLAIAGISQVRSAARRRLRPGSG